MSKVQGYCFKDKKKVDIDDPKFSINKAGRPMVKGKCSVCGGDVFAMVSADKVPPEIRAKIGTGKKTARGGGSGGKSRRSRASRSKSRRGGGDSRRSRASRSKSRGSRRK